MSLSSELFARYLVPAHIVKEKLVSIFTHTRIQLPLLRSVHTSEHDYTVVPVQLNIFPRSVHHLQQFVRQLILPNTLIPH